MNIEEKRRSVLSGMLVTIDGPAGSGKSTTASILAERLGLAYLDTGAMYRAVTYKVLQSGVDPEDGEKAGAIAENIDLILSREGKKPFFLLEGGRVEKEIRSPEVSGAVSPVSRHYRVRRAMIRLQRKIAAEGGIVAEGRDTGSTVFPHADVKIFLVADLAARADRRASQLKSMGIEQDTAEIRENIARRDEIDSGREVSPLLKAPGAIEVDTSNITIDEQVELIEKAVRKKADILVGLKIWPGENNSFSKKRFYFHVSQMFVKAVLGVIFGLKVYGSRNLDYRENYIFASTHVSYFDPPVVGSVLRREIWFVAKKELFRNRFFAWLIEKYHAIPVDRDELDRTTLRTITEKLNSGDSVLMFPEGTRSRNGEIKKLKPGLGMIALRVRRSIVPVYHTGTDNLVDCMLRKRRLEIRIGPAIRIDAGYTPADKKSDYGILSSMVYEELRMLRDESKA